jgi:hypothetical protein
MKAEARDDVAARLVGATGLGSSATTSFDGGLGRD